MTIILYICRFCYWRTHKQLIDIYQVRLTICIGVSIYMRPMWLPNYFWSLSICIYTRCLNIQGTHVFRLLFLFTQYMKCIVCLNIHGTYVTALLYLPTQYMYKISQYTWDPCVCPIISAHTVNVYIPGVSIYMGPMWLLITLLICLLFSFRFENSIPWQLLILDHNALDKRGKKKIFRHDFVEKEIIQNYL